MSLPSRAGQEENHSRYIFYKTSYTDTKDLVVGLETPNRGQLVMLSLDRTIRSSTIM